jgi:protein phosphatase
MFIVESAGITDVGKKRKGNEDALLVDDTLGLYVVADGMGGHRAGEVASTLVVESMRDYLKRFKESGSVEELEDIDTSLSKEANRILAGIQLSNHVVFQISNSKEAYLGMGSTVSVVAFNERTLVAANVGDSPIYLIHKGKIELLSEPHTVLAEQSAIDPEGAQELGEEFKHMLTRAMGTEETVKANICEIPYFKDDMLVISSDGLSDLVTPEEILEITSKTHPDKACQGLVDLANERGGTDNITVVVLKVKKCGSNNGKMKNLISKVTEGFSNITAKKKSNSQRT